MNKKTPVRQNNPPPDSLSRKTAATVRERNDKRRKRSAFNTLLNIFLAVLSTVFCLIILLVVLAQTLDLQTLRREFAFLANIIEVFEFSAPLPEYVGQHESEFDREMRAINSDYICWMKIDGTDISYPVVRGDDNEKYLDLTFFGEDNSYGALFMDYRCAGTNVPHIIIYGHNSRYGEMFGRLNRFLDSRYLAENPIITLIVNDRIVEYEIFSARRADINDHAYYMDFNAPGSFEAFAERNGAPPDTAQILTLSTCVSGGSNNARMIVQGALVN